MITLMTTYNQASRGTESVKSAVRYSLHASQCPHYIVHSCYDSDPQTILLYKSSRINFRNAYEITKIWNPDYTHESLRCVTHQMSPWLGFLWSCFVSKSRKFDCLTEQTPGGSELSIVPTMPRLIDKMANRKAPIERTESTPNMNSNKRARNVLESIPIDSKHY